MEVVEDGGDDVHVFGRDALLERVDALQVDELLATLCIDLENPAHCVDAVHDRLALDGGLAEDLVDGADQ